MIPALQASEVSSPGRLAPTSLTLPSGTMTAVIGPNGSGKTSLLRALARVGSTAGTVAVCGEEVDASSPARRRSLLSFLPASREVTWPISVHDVIALGVSGSRRDKVGKLLADMKLQPFVDRPIDELSTGERARVLLARALAAEPRLLLLDEPLSNLDPYWVLRTLEIVREAVSGGAAALVSLHDLALLSHFDRAILMANGEVRLDAAPTTVLGSPKFEEAFRVQAAPTGWRMVR